MAKRKGKAGAPGNYQCDKCKRWFAKMPGVEVKIGQRRVVGKVRCPDCGGTSFYDPNLTETFGSMFGFNKLGGKR